jgi:cytochrome c1
MLKAGDPIAKTLSTRYKQMQMPNLQLTDRQVADVIAFLGSVRPVRSQ